MKMRNYAAQASVLALGLMLSACGGGGGSVASTPTPTPAPAPTYTKLADLTGDRTFQTGGIHWQNGPGGISGRGADNFGSGVTVAYSAASGSYTVTPPGGIPVTFTPADNDPAVTSGSTQGFRKVSGSNLQTLRLSVPSIGGVALSYLVIGNFLDSTASGASVWIAVGGVPTIASDVPKTGTATYTVETGATVLSNGVQYTALPTSGSTATFSANFGTGAITTSVMLAGAPTGGGAVQNFGTFNGTGTITSGGPGFTGTFATTTGAGFSGAFFGPQALEVAYGYNFISGTTEAFGVTYGKKP